MKIISKTADLCAIVICSLLNKACKNYKGILTVHVC